MPLTARCGAASDLPPGSSKVVKVKDHLLALFNFAGAIYALDNTCPHQGGPLGEGYLETNGVVSCPWHGWTFDLKTGVSPIDGDVRVACYPVRVVDGQILVDLP
jgi:NAD(P)H-dependent nitrite reductase small subunit